MRPGSRPSNMPSDEKPPSPPATPPSDDLAQWLSERLTPPPSEPLVPAPDDGPPAPPPPAPSHVSDLFPTWARWLLAFGLACLGLAFAGDAWLSRPSPRVDAPDIVLALDAPPPPPTQCRTYTVQAGDTLSSVALRFGTSLSVLVVRYV